VSYILIRNYHLASYSLIANYLVSYILITRRFSHYIAFADTRF